MKRITTLFVLSLLLSTQVVAKLPTPSVEDVLRSKAALKGWCQTLEAMGAFQDKHNLQGGDAFVNAFFFSELEKVYPVIPLAEKLMHFNNTCNY